MTLARILAEAAPLEDGFATSVPETWMQGRTAYGGFSTALALMAARQVGGSLPPLRSGMVSFVGPATGRVEARARVLRRGRNAVWIDSRIEGEGGTALTASFVFMAPVPSVLGLTDAGLPADVIPLDEAQPIDPPAVAPAFARMHLDARRAIPRPAEPQPDMCRWLRVRPEQGAGSPPDPMLDLVLCADGLPPAVMPLLNAATPVSSMTWQFNLLTAEPRTENGWWLLRSTADHARQGCSSQHMRIWNSAGEPMAVGMQSIAVFG